MACEYSARQISDGSSSAAAASTQNGAQDHYYEVSVRLVRKRRKRKASPIICSPKEAFGLMQHLGVYDREVFYCLHLDTRNRLVSYEEVSKGTVNASLVHPREVYKAAILSSANAIVLVHNHPSGDPSPSREDLDITGRLQKAGDILGIEVLDHIIIGDDTFYSLKEESDM